MCGNYGVIYYFPLYEALIFIQNCQMKNIREFRAEAEGSLIEADFIRFD